MPVHLYGLPGRHGRDRGDRRAARARDRRGRRPGPRRRASATAGRRRSASGRFSLYATKNVSDRRGRDDHHRRRRRRRPAAAAAQPGHAGALPVRDGRPQLPPHRPAGRGRAAAAGAPRRDRRRAGGERRARCARAWPDIDGLVLTADRPPGRDARLPPVHGADHGGRRGRPRRVRRALAERGVGCGVYYPRLVFDYDCYRDHPRSCPDDVPNAAAIAREVVSLPVHPFLTEADLDEIVERRAARCCCR